MTLKSGAVLEQGYKDGEGKDEIIDCKRRRWDRIETNITIEIKERWKIQVNTG